MTNLLRDVAMKKGFNMQPGQQLRYEGLEAWESYIWNTDHRQQQLIKELPEPTSSLNQ